MHYSASLNNDFPVLVYVFLKQKLWCVGDKCPLESSKIVKKLSDKASENAQTRSLVAS